MKTERRKEPRQTPRPMTHIKEKAIHIPTTKLKAVSPSGMSSNPKRSWSAETMTKEKPMGNQISAGRAKRMMPARSSVICF